MRLCNQLVLAFLLAEAALLLPAQQPSAPAAAQPPSLTVDRDPVRSPDGEPPALSSVRKQGEGYVLRTDVEEVALNCTVLHANQPVSGLKKEDFKVFEDGVQQALLSFQHNDLPVSIAIVVDNSGSMETKRPSVNKSALDLIQASNPQDEAFVVNFADEAFIAELAAQVESRFPVLEALIRDRLLPIVRDESAARGDLPPDVARLFYKDDLIPLDELFDLSRKSLLVDAKMLMPFWYSVPILSSLARLVHRLTAGRAEKAAARAQAVRVVLEEAKDKATTGKRGLTTKERRAEFEAAANAIAKELLPQGYSLDEYLDELEGRWNSLLNPDSKQNLTSDVDSLTRDYLRGVLRTMGTSTFTLERLKNLGSSLADSPTLMKIKNHHALELYIQLYMVKVLGARVDAS